jgi:FCP1-like phosphatase family protein
MHISKNTKTEEEDITKLEFNEADDKSFKIYHNEGVYVQKGRKMGEYVNRLGHKVPIISDFFGKILKIDVEEKTVVIEKCKHEIVLYKLCASCGCEMPKSKPFISIHSQLSFSQSKAKEEEESVVKKYLDNKKLILLLDIDNTILHACPFNLTKEEYESLKTIYGWEITEIIISTPFPTLSPSPYTTPVLHKQKIVLKFRPMLKTFLENIRDKYEIYIYTHATKEYAEEVIKYLNKTLEYEYFSTHRLVARTDLLIEAKSIKRIFPTTDDMVVIVDDRTDVWGEDTKNVVNLVPYFFFYDDKFFKIPTKYKTGKDEDYVLFSVEKLINFINEAFYFYYANFNFTRTNVKTILRNKLRGILGGKNFNISGIYGTDVDIYDTRHGYIIDYLGGNLFEEYDEDINIIITKEFKSNLLSFIFLSYRN